MILTLSDYWMGRDRTHGLYLSTEIQANARRTIELVNDLLRRMQADGVQLEVHPRTGTIVSSGWRPPAINANTPGAAVNSRHLTGQAIDLYDPDGDIDEWCMVSADSHLAKIGLWLEHPAATKGWCHLQTVPPRSKRRVFYP